MPTTKSVRKRGDLQLQVNINKIFFCDMMLFELRRIGPTIGWLENIL